MRSTRGTYAFVAALALVVGLVAPVASAGAATSRLSAVDWTQVPGATPDDLIVNPYSNYLGNYLGPGFSYTGRASGIADFCAATDATGAYPCPFSDFHDYFTLNSATANGLAATVNVTVTNTHSTNSYLSFTSDSRDTWQQVFSATSHGWLNFAELIGGQQVGQSSTNQVVCQLAVPCTITFSMTDDYGRFIGNKWLATSLNVASQIFIPLNVVSPPTPPTPAFSASLSGTAPHDWAFDASGSTATSPKTVATYRWTYGDGSNESTTTPTTHHTYTDGSPHTASLVVVDSAGTSSASVSHDLSEPQMIVNSTGDAPATDASAGCDTGQKVQNGEPECTLRAAIQSLDAGVGGTKITFALPAGSTTITAATPLPDITTAGTTIDGTEVSGMPTISGSWVHVKNASNVTITNVSVVGGQDYGVYFDSSPNSTITASRIGVTAGGAVSAPAFAVTVSGSGATTIGGSGDAGNVVAGTATGIAVVAAKGGAPVNAAAISGNWIGVMPDGTLIAGMSHGVGVEVFGLPESPEVVGLDLENNRIAGFTTNVAVIGPHIVSPIIRGNHIGVGDSNNVVLGSARQNLRVDGAPGAVIDGNHVAGGTYDILVSGTLQTSIDSDADGNPTTHFRYPSESQLLSTPATGTHTTISNNAVGTSVLLQGSDNQYGITAWQTADDLTISNNIVVTHNQEEVQVTGGGARVSVTGNTIGSLLGGSPSPGEGVLVTGPPAPSITQNVVVGLTSGIRVGSLSGDAVVSGNTVGLGLDGQAVAPIGAGITVEGDRATIGPDNTVGNATDVGIKLTGANAHVISNRIGVSKFGAVPAGNQIGILVDHGATGAVVGGSGAGNTIVANATGLGLRESGAEVSHNTFGLITSGTLGNSTAIVASKDASIHDNTIAASKVQGIHVDPGAVVKIIHNSIYGTVASDSGIVAPVAGPTSVEAARVTHGSSARTWLVLKNVPTDSGSIEVFGNASCADPEGKIPLFTTPTTSATNRVLSIADRTDLNGLTVTVTTATGTTQFSNCVPSGRADDSDGDGIPDLVEALYPSGPTPAAQENVAAFVGDNQQWVQIVAAHGGTLSNVSPIDDPDPSGHPGATFPLGLIDWTLSGIEPGSLAGVAFILPGTVVNGWWKYSPHHDPQFYDYGYSSIAGYGAKVTAADIPGSGLSTVVAVIVPDGGVGDDDGLENGVIHDPAAPAIVPLPPGTVPVIPVTLPAPGSFPAILPSAVSRAPLATTGSDPTPGLGGAGLAILFGMLLMGVAVVRRRRALRR